jgi:transketolase
MIGVATGLSLTGKIPFAHSFAAFVSRRACDQIFVSAAYAKLNVKIVGSDPGIMAALNGGTHMPFEDMGIMRGIPGITVLEPTDTVMLKYVLKQMANTYGVQYMRLLRKNAVKIFEEGSVFEIGKAVTLKEGTDATVIASGFCVAESIKACKTLSEQGINAKLLNIFTWKPIDAEAIVKAAKETGAIITAENHNVINGLGSAVAEILTQNYPVIQEMVGVQDEFGEVGPVDYLAERFKLSEQYIVEAVKKAVARKELLNGQWRSNDL